MQLHNSKLYFRADMIARGRKILSDVEECGINRFNEPGVRYLLLIVSNFEIKVSLVLSVVDI